MVHSAIAKHESPSLDDVEAAELVSERRAGTWDERGRPLTSLDQALGRPQPHQTTFRCHCSWTLGEGAQLDVETGWATIPHMQRLAVLLASLVLSACATGRPLGARSVDDGFRPFAAAPSAIIVPAATAANARPLEVRPGARASVVEIARGLVGSRRVEVAGRRFGDDCTGLVRGVYSALGVDLMSAGEAGDNGVTAIWRFTAQRGRLYDGGRPVPGDLVFFRETYDLNRDGQVNDGLTHIGLVDDVEADGTVLVIHRVARGVVRYRMNLTAPTTAKGPTGKVLNDGLRLPGNGSAPRLTGELFVSFGTLLPVEGSLARR